MAFIVQSELYVYDCTHDLMNRFAFKYDRDSIRYPTTTGIDRQTRFPKIRSKIELRSTLIVSNPYPDI